ncbi:MAG: M56 family metallopeptidase [Oscillospiraceae bacterium]|nr:M56 family metallopeptidase [Oscillospiraceae bacterium]
MAALLEMTLTGGVLILLVLLLRAIFLNRLPKTAFIVMWAVVILRLLVPVSFFGTTAAETASEAPEVYTLEAVTPTAEAEVREVITLNSYNSSTEPTAETAERADLFGIIWLIGAVVCAVALALSYILSIRRFNKSENLESDFIASFQSSNKLRRTVTVKLSDKTTTPLTYGIIHPVILLPMSMDLSDQKQLKYVLMHEYIHIRKLDNLLKGISSAAVCVHWFNPLVWVMNKFLSRDIELRCDEALLRQCSGDCRADYALTLIDLEDQRRGYAPATTAFAMRASEERIVAIMKYRKITPSSVLATILCIVLLCTALVGCGAVGKTESETIDYTEDETSDSFVALSTTTEVTHSDGIYTLEEALSSTISVEGFIAEGYEGGVTDYTFRSVEYTDTLPDGMYISDGVIYNADGEEVGSLTNQVGYEDMVIDGTGEAADGYTFVVIDFDMTNVLEQWHSDDSLQTICLELYPLFVGMSETSENYFYQYYPIYDNAARVYEYHLTSETVVNYDEIVADAAAKVYEIPEYTVYSYTPFDEGMTCNIRLIYLIGDGAMDMSLYLGLQEFSGTLHTIGQSYVKLN